MNGKKLTQVNVMWGGWFSRELKISILFLGLISFSNLIFSNNTFALYTPTLSASVGQTILQINGNQVINSTGKTTEIPFNFTVNTNNRTGYTATLSAETENTALTNATSAAGAKINSISTNSSLNNLPNNTWGYKFGASTNYTPIPALSTPAQILQTTVNTNGNESNQLSIGMKLTDNLESGNYTNKLILSFVSNPYTPIAIMANGQYFNYRLKGLETATNKIERFKKSPVAPAASINAKNIENEESDYEIKLWLDPTDKTAYYYTEPEKVYLNANSSEMFYSKYDEQKIKNILEIDLSNFDTSKVTNMSNMFSGLSNLTTLNLSNFNTSKVTNMRFMFFHASNLTSLNLSNFDTSRVADMQYMFSYASNLTSLNLSNFDTSKVINMRYMFYGMSNLAILNLSSFDTSKVTNMNAMFYDVHSLTTLNLSNFDTSKVTNMSYMFYGMRNLTTLNLSSFDTSKVTDMEAMFANMSSLISLNLSNFDTSKVTSMGRIFFLEDKDIPKDKLERIYVNNDFNTDKLTNTYQMFGNRKKLRGGNGSYLADPSTADKSWLRIDDPAHGRPGYFTRKP